MATNDALEIVAVTQYDMQETLVVHDVNPAMTIPEVTKFTCCTCKRNMKKEAEPNYCVVRAACNKQPCEVLRCKLCHRLKSRVTNLTTKRGSLAHDWSLRSEADRAAFITNPENHLLFGKDLEQRVTQAVMSTKTKSWSETQGLT